MADEDDDYGGIYEDECPLCKEEYSMKPINRIVQTILKNATFKC